MKRISALRTAAAAALSGLALASAAAQENYNVKGPRSEAIVATQGQRDGWYGGPYHFAPAHRAGDYLFFSGVVAGARDDAPLDEEGYKAAVRQQFETLGQTLAAAGASFDDVVKLRSFHVFDSPYVALTKRQQFDAFAAVKDEFIGEPYPAWTGVGTTALFPDRGLVELEIIAYAPKMVRMIDD